MCKEYHPMKVVIKSPTPMPVKRSLTVFLAGPMKGAPKWQRTVPKLAESLGIDGIMPPWSRNPLLSAPTRSHLA